MNLFEKIEDVLDNDKFILPKREISEDVDPEFEERIFFRMADFIIGLDPDKLSDSQIEFVIEVIEECELDDEGEDLQELKTPRLAKRTSVTKNNASKRWYRANRGKIKKRKAKFKRSSEGRKRARMKERNARIGKTASGRRTVRYHVRKRSDRSDREKNLSRG